MSKAIGRPVLMRTTAWSALAAAAALLVAADIAAAQQPGAAPAASAAKVDEPGVASANYLAPFPENDTWRALVIGDGMAEGLLGGILEAVGNEPRLQFQRKHRNFGSLLRSDLDDELRSIEDQVAKERVHIAVLMLGVNDRGGMRAPNGRRLPVGSDEWRAQYAARIDKVVRALRRKNVAVYWVGLPIMRREDMSSEAEAMNELFRERTGSNGGRFIDIFSQTGEDGQFTDRGPDVTGKPARLREADGVYFTPQGYRKIAFYLERDLKRDMTTARNERVVPLAGNEAEQRKINPGGAAAGPAGAAQAVAAAAGAKGAKAGPIPTARTAPQALAAGTTILPAQPAEGQSGDQRADHARIAFKQVGASGREEQITVDILRPALPASVVALVTRRESGDKASQVGDTVTDTLSNGLMIMRSVTPSADAQARPGTRAAPSAQPFFRALVKGERLPPKPGRADDFRWPREDDLPPPPEATAGGATITSPVQLRPAPKGSPRPGRS